MDHPIVKRTLRCELSHDEQYALGRELARAQQELEAAQTRKKEVGAQLTAEVKGAEAQTQKLGRILANGYEYRDVECRVVYSADGLAVSLVRTDTGEIAETRALTAEERQRRLDLDGEAA